MHVLPLGLDKFTHALEVDLQKKGKGHLMSIDASMELLPHDSGYFGHDPLGKFDVNWRNF